MTASDERLAESLLHSYAYIYQLTGIAIKSWVNKNTIILNKTDSGVSALTIQLDYIAVAITVTTIDTNGKLLDVKTDVPVHKVHQDFHNLEKVIPEVLQVVTGPVCNLAHYLETLPAEKIQPIIEQYNGQTLSMREIERVLSQFWLFENGEQLLTIEQWSLG